MEINSKMLAELAGQMGMDTGRVADQETAGKVAEMAEKYRGKSDQELMMEIINLKESMRANPRQFEKQMKAIKSLGAFMNDEQKMRLEKVVSLLEKE